MARIISVLNEKGGCAKTTSVLECAYHIAKRGNQVLVVDLDPQANATIMLTGEANWRPGLFDVLSPDENAPDVKMALRPAREDWPRILVLPADRRLQRLDVALHSEMNRNTVLKRALAPLLPHFQYVLIDLPPALGLSTVNALVASTHYLVPTDRSEYAKQAIPGIQKLAENVRQAHNPALECLGIFLTGYEKGGSHAVRALLADLEAQHPQQLLDVRVSHSVKVIESQQAGKPVGLIAPDSSVSEAYRTISKIIMGDNIDVQREQEHER
jgi:chromosome partitioning protein